MTSSILGIGTAIPKYKSVQQDLVEFMKSFLAKDQRTARKIQVLFGLSGIESRYSVLPDYTSDIESFEFFPRNKSLEPLPSTQQRIEKYQKESLPLALASIDDCFQNCRNSTEELTHIITVSCTGMYAPGLDIEIIEKLGLSTSIERTAINFMGCYAVFNALKVADNIVRSKPESKVLIVAVELCSLHFQKSTEEDFLLSNALFGGGAASIVVGNFSGSTGFILERFHNELALKGKDEMGWFIRDFGFEMRLSNEIPAIIEKGIQELSIQLLERLGLQSKDIDFFAIHPGGRKILDVIEETLDIDPEKNRCSREVLKEYGNMSSPSVLFALKKIWDDMTKEDHDKRILSFAFGPGLTMESMLLKIAV